MSRIVFWGLILLVALAPLPLASDRPLPWSVLGFGVGVLLILWVIGGTRRRARGSRVADRYLIPPALIFAAVIAWSVIQIVGPVPAAWDPAALQRMHALLGVPAESGMSLDPAAGWTVILRLLAYAGIFFLAWEYGRNRRDATVMLGSVVCATLVYALYGLVVQLGQLDLVLWYAKTDYRDSLTGPFINRNSFATYVGIGLLVGLAFVVNRWLRRRSGISLHPAGRISVTPEARATLAGLATIVLAVALVLTRSRGGFYSVAAGLVVCTGFLIANGMLRGRTLLLAGSVGCLATVVVLVAGGGGLATRLESGGVSIEEGRGAIFGPTLEAVGDRPLTGYGLGSFRGVYEAVTDGSLNEAGFYVDKAHNSYLEMALEVGVPAAAAMVVVLFSFAALCAIALARRRARLFALSGLAATTLIAVHAAVDFSLAMPAVAAVFVLVLGTGSAQSLRRLTET